MDVRPGEVAWNIAEFAARTMRPALRRGLEEIYGASAPQAGERTDRALRNVAGVSAVNTLRAEWPRLCPCVRVSRGPQTDASCLGCLPLRSG